jgi:serpin B
MVAERAPTTDELTLPKLDLKSSVDATKTLKALGMKTPFDSGAAEFPKLVSPTNPVVYISDVLHQASVSIDEKGTEASAATAISIANTSAAIEPPTPQVVNVDRPFLFVIRDNPTGGVLFVGQVVTPG